tara:strand:+ start:411 stop:533 length:123 start_codon:yes stop_codon:yes gene_type:complete
LFKNVKRRYPVPARKTIPPLVIPIITGTVNITGLGVVVVV